MPLSAIKTESHVDTSLKMYNNQMLIESNNDFEKPLTEQNPKVNSIQMPIDNDSKQGIAELQIKPETKLTMTSKFEECFSESSVITKITAEKDLGKLFKLNEGMVSFNSELNEEFSGKLNSTYLLLTKEKLDLLQKILSINNRNKVNLYYAFTGMFGVGKSTLMQWGAYLARSLGFLTLFIPNGKSIIQNVDDLYVKLVQTITDMIDYQRDLLGRIKIISDNEFCKGTLLDLLNYAINHKDKATMAFIRFVQELHIIKEKTFVGLDQWDCFLEYEEEAIKRKGKLNELIKEFLEIEFKLNNGISLKSISATSAEFFKRLKDAEST